MVDLSIKANPNKKRDKRKHIIEDISHARDFVLCKCGWDGTILGYDMHRLGKEGYV